MTPDEAAPLATASQRRWQEIAPTNLSAHRVAFRDALEQICRSAEFQSSPRSREFLCHVVLRTLNGDTASLKERLIGMELLGRDASYDTSSDAGVRVRANDVRKRLIRFHAGDGKDLDYTFALPSGSYIPQFLCAAATREKLLIPEPPTMPAAAVPKAQPERLSLYQLTLPMVIASFLCIICMRWQVSQEKSFDRFWNYVLAGSNAVLYLPPVHADGAQDAVKLQELDEAAPLLDLAGEFHRPLRVDSSANPEIPQGGNIFSLGVNIAQRLADDLNPAAAPDQSRPRLRFSVQHASDGTVIIDHQAAHGEQPLTHAALLTIDSGPRVLLSISGTDDASVRALVERLCSPRIFPSALAESFRRGLVTQALFYDFPHSKAVIVRQQRYQTRASEEPIP